MLQIMCLICAHFLCTTSGSPAMNEPDFESDWTRMGSGVTHQSFMVFNHNLGETPILVDVQVKSLDAPNMDFIFPGVGSCIRDDDNVEMFGDVCYLYNEIDILVATPKMSNEQDVGMAIYAANDAYFAGPNNQASREALVRVRAWIQSSLPTPEFFTSGINVVAQSQNPTDVYKEVNHNLRDYPSLVLVRIKLGDGPYAGYMSDAMGSSVFVQQSQGTSSFSIVSFGFDDQNVRVWVPSSITTTYLWAAYDGHAFPGSLAVATYGELEIKAWRFSSFTPALVQTTALGVGVQNENFTISHVYPGLNFYFIQIWAQATEGPNTGFRFRGSGAVGYHTGLTEDPVCTYGGLAYAFNSDEVRFWRPTDATNGGIICIASASGLGNNSQSSISADVIMHTWLFNTTVRYPEQVVENIVTCYEDQMLV